MHKNKKWTAEERHEAVLSYVKGSSVCLELIIV